MEGLWPSECANNNYEHVNTLACLVCSVEQPKFTYIDGNTKIVRVCKSLIENIYGVGSDADSLLTKTKKFE